MRLSAEVKPASWGFVGGVVSTIASGFIWGGWATAKRSEARAADQVQTGVVAVLTPRASTIRGIHPSLRRISPS
jgi:hypothetical protein